VNEPFTAPPPRDAGARYFAWLYTPGPARDGAAALLAIEHEIMASAREGLDHSVAHARLGWWQEEIERLLAAIPVHPGALTLRNLYLAAQLPPPDLRPLPLLAARELARHALGRVPPAADELADDASMWAEGLFLPYAALALGAVDELAPAADLGRALHAHDRAPDARSRAVLETARHALPERQRPALRGALVWAALALREPRPATRRREAFAENWAAWRAARRAMRGRT
jgi:hypothetical protein